MLSMLIYGARNMIALALLTTGCAFGLGSLLGFLAATMGGWVDQVLSRFVDVVISIPTLIFALIVLSSTGTSIFALVTVIAIIYAMPVYRIARAVAMDIEVMDYVEAARLRGEGLWWIMRKEILPNALTPLAAEFGLRFCFVFLLISGLSFLGLGLQPPLADWGAMVRDNGGGIAWGFMHPLVPATCIALLTIGINLIVDSVVQKASGLREDH
jgi:peptide/nickel transport system permease protein